MNSAKADLTFGLGVIALAILMLIVIIPIGVDSPGEIEILALAPAFWPNIIMGLTIVIGLTMSGRAFYRMRAGDQGESASTETAADADAPSEPEMSDQSRSGSTLKAVAAVIIMFGFYFALPELGFVACSIVVILALAFLAGERRWLIVVPTAVLVPIALYLFFTHVAVVRIPVGLFEGMF